MRINLAEDLGGPILSAASADDLHEALLRSAREMAFDHFALSLEIGSGGDAGDVGADPQLSSVVGRRLCRLQSRSQRPDPARGRAQPVGVSLERGIDVDPGEWIGARDFDTGRRHGIADGFTIPGHLPG